MQRAVRASTIVILLPLRQLLPHILQCEEHLHIQTLVSEPSIETLNEAILNRLAGPNEVQLNPVTVRCLST